MTTSSDLKNKINALPETMSIGFTHDDGNVTKELIAFKNNGLWVLTEDAVVLIQRVFNKAEEASKMRKIRFARSNYGPALRDWMEE